jgi:hypothetical protein
MAARLERGMSGGLTLTVDAAISHIACLFNHRTT